MGNGPSRVAVLPLRNRLGKVIAYALIDAADADQMGQWRWTLNTNGYVWRSVNGGRRHVYLHRSLMEREPGDGLFVDHVNRDKLDNRRENLRVVTPAESRQNTPSLGGTSGHRGVSWDRHRGKWKAAAQLDRRMHHLGRFDTEDEAAEAVRRWRAKHMPFATEDDSTVAQQSPAWHRYKRDPAA